MNTGAEAMETAIKTPRKWGYQITGIPNDQAKIVIAGGNFHGRTITIVSFSEDSLATADFGAFTPGFVRVSFGDADAARAVIDDRTAAVLMEPIQGERGVIIPPDGYLRSVRDACTEANVLMIADEIQSGRRQPRNACACGCLRPDDHQLPMSC
jgi:ornithine--oxo-acid transaminase